MTPPDKRVPRRFPVIDALADRWSARSFAPDLPAASVLASIFEAARLAPSAHNTQPTRFVLTRAGTPCHARLASCLMAHNFPWASRAPVLILCAIMRERPTDRRDAHGEVIHVAYPHAMHDLGLAVMSALTQATALGLVAHPIAGFDPDLAAELFALPPRYLAGLVIALGHPGPADALPEALRVRELAPRVRRPLEELVFEDAFGQPTALFAEALSVAEVPPRVPHPRVIVSPGARSGADVESLLSLARAAPDLFARWPEHPRLPCSAHALLWDRPEVHRFAADSGRRVRVALGLPAGPAPEPPRLFRWTRVVHALVGHLALGVPLTEGARAHLAASRSDDPVRVLGDLVAGLPALLDPTPDLSAITVTHRDLRLILDRDALAMPGLDFAAVAGDADYQRAHAPLVRDTLAALRAFAPSDARAFADLIHHAALKPVDAGHYDDWSEPELPGSFVASAIASPYVMADHFLHELQHNRLSLIEEHGPLFAPPVPTRLYSPWRDIPRGPLGIFHGLYVFLAVERFWRAVFLRPDAALAEDLRPPDASERAFATDRLLRLPRQLQLALTVLRERVAMTPLGAELLDALAADIEALTPIAGLPEDAPAMAFSSAGILPDGPSVRASLDAHLHRHGHV